MNIQSTKQTQIQQITKDDFQLMKYEDKWKTLESLIVANQSLLQQLEGTAISDMALMNENIDLKNKNLALNNRVHNLFISLDRFYESQKDSDKLIKGLALLCSYTFFFTASIYFIALKEFNWTFL